jgi:EmrB/QacA subfamily drug resistance transporter
VSTTTATSPAGFADRAPVELPHPVRMRVLGAVMLGIFLAALDQTVVGTALPRIITDLRGNEFYTWAFTAYLLTSTISGPVYGKLSDLFGRRPVFLFGVSLFLVGSALCGLSQEMWQFIAFRGVQGLGAGAMFPIALAVIGDLFAPSERGRYQGLFGAVFGVSILIGPAIGGIITDNFGWHWVFFVNLPIGAVVLWLIYRYLPAYHLGSDRVRIDYVGAALFAAALVPFLIGLTNRNNLPWEDPWVGGLILLGIVIGVIFVLWESRAPEPIVSLGLFRNRSFTISVSSVFLAAFGFFAAVVFLPRWFQVVQGSSATESGYQILPLLGGLIVSAIASGQIVARTGRYKLLIFVAMVVMAIGLFLLSTMTRDTSVPVLWLYMLITGLGVGPTFAVFTLVVQNSVPIRQLGSATSNLTFFQSVGGTVGLAVTGTIFASTMTERTPVFLQAANVPPEVLGAAGSVLGRSDLLTSVGALGPKLLGALPDDARAAVEPFIDAIVDAIYRAFSVATASTFTVGIVAALIAAGLTLLYKEKRMGAMDPVQSPDAGPIASSPAPGFIEQD